MTPVRFTRARDLAAVAVIAAVGAHLVLLVGYGAVPPLPVLASLPLLALAVVEAAFGYGLRRRIQGGRIQGGRIQGKRDAAPPDPLTAARAVALAKASSVLGALMGGAWLGVVTFLLPRRTDLRAAAADLPAAVVGVLCGAALVAAALWLEHCCRTPDNGDRSDRGPGSGPGADRDGDRSDGR